MIHEFYDMDKQEKVRYMSESSNASTSGYSTMSPSPAIAGPGSNRTLGNGSPSSQFSLSPAHSPATAALQTEFSNLSTNSPLQHNSTHYNQLHPTSASLVSSNMFIGGHNYFNLTTPISLQQPYTTTALNSGLQHNAMFIGDAPGMSGPAAAATSTMGNIKREYPAKLEILEHPVEKFRFRYKSEMHGTHGSLNGANSKRTPKTFPEVQLTKYKEPAIIRCSLFQTNLDSPHSHQLVVRKDERDVCDPHDLHVSEERGYVAQFMNMGIIHTAKKFIFEELLKKKQDRLVFQMGRRELSTKQKQELHKETEKEAKDMNLNQVRLCFEAFKVEDSGIWIPIAAPVYTNAINNRKSAQTGELRIVRLSIAAGSVTGNDELILLVEKVSKKNIKVRFFEQNEDDETVWEEYAKFRESDVHHQYAIVCQTPPYKNKDIDRQVEVFIELIRPSDDERSFPALQFRYKPREAIVSRKRRRTCSTATTSSSGTGSAASSLELPKPVQEQVAHLAVGTMAQAQGGGGSGVGSFGIIPMDIPTISEEFNKDFQIRQFVNSKDFNDTIHLDLEELNQYCPFINNASSLLEDLNQNVGLLQKDGVSSATSMDLKRQQLRHYLSSTSTADDTSSTAGNINVYLQRIFKLNDTLRFGKGNPTPAATASAAQQIKSLFLEHADSHSGSGDTLLHEVISQKRDNLKLAIKTFDIIIYFGLQELVNQALNSYGESALHYASLHDRAHYIRPLLGLNCDPNIQDRHNNTALHMAVKEEHTKVIDSFLNAVSKTKINLALKNDQGLTPLHLAIRQDNFEVAKKLIKYDRTAINICDKDGNNALHLAVQQQNVELVVLILDAHHVQHILTAQNMAGYTALELARQQQDNKKSKANDIVQLLEPLYKHLNLEQFIKIKEELESSSTEDDEESVQSTMDIQHDYATVKQEEEIDIDDDTNTAMDDDNGAASLRHINDTRKLEDLLNDTQKFNALVKLLDQKSTSDASGATSPLPKWQQLAEKSKMQHLVFLWNNAEAMLNYVKTKSSNIEYSLFARALAEVDSSALSVLQNTQAKPPGTHNK